MSNWTVLTNTAAPSLCVTGMATVWQVNPAVAAAEAAREEQRKKDAEVKEYFEALGYEVDQDWNRSHGAWHEIIHPKEGLICQIDQGVPLAHIVQDFTAMAAGAKQGTSPTDYTICSKRDDPAFEGLLQRVAKTQMGAVQEKMTFL